MNGLVNGLLLAACLWLLVAVVALLLGFAAAGAVFTIIGVLALCTGGALWLASDLHPDE